jgi:hypothetical protein
MQAAHPGTQVGMGCCQHNHLRPHRSRVVVTHSWQHNTTQGGQPWVGHGQHTASCSRTRPLPYACRMQGFCTRMSPSRDSLPAKRAPLPGAQEAATAGHQADTEPLGATWTRVRARVKPWLQPRPAGSTATARATTAAPLACKQEGTAHSSTCTWPDDRCVARAAHRAACAQTASTRRLSCRHAQKSHNPRSAAHGAARAHTAKSAAHVRSKHRPHHASTTTSTSLLHPSCCRCLATYTCHHDRPPSLRCAGAPP